MPFFDFLTDVPGYRQKPARIARLNKRHMFLIADFADEIRNARVLDLGAHDGRWAYAFADAGAASVTAIESRAVEAQKLNDYPDADLKARLSMRIADVFAGLEAADAAKETYDIVAIYGLLYHVMDHFRLLDLVRRLNPKLVIIDGDFAKQQGAVIRLVREQTDNPLNATAQFDGQMRTVKGIPSRAALEMMADALGYNAVWSDWGRLPQDQRANVSDYYLSPARSLRRGTCALRPKSL